MNRTRTYAALGFGAVATIVSSRSQVECPTDLSERIDAGTGIYAMVATMTTDIGFIRVNIGDPTNFELIDLREKSHLLDEWERPTPSN